jgi:transketolase
MYKIGERVALRGAFGPSVLSVAKNNNRIVVVTADLGGSVNIGEYQSAFPDRYINTGVAEASMIGVCAGLASEGMLPFAVTFGSFLGRAIDHIRQSVLHNKLKVNIVGSHGGISNGMDGPSAHAIEDIGIFRAMPEFSIVAPSCPNQLPQVIAATCEVSGPVFLRLYREPLPVFTDPGEKFEFGKAIHRAKGNDVTLLTYGPHVGFCLEWLDQLQSSASVDLFEVHTIEPLDRQALLASIKRTRRVVVVEDHFKRGALTSAMSELIASAGVGATLRSVSLQGFARSGPYYELRDAMGLGVDGIRRAIDDVTAAANS